MNITLVTCPRFAIGRRGLRNEPYVPLGLLSNAAIAEAEGHRVQIIDINRALLEKQVGFDKHFAEQAAQLIYGSEPDLVGLTTMCDSYPQVLRITNALRSIRSIPTILGGPQATAVDRVTLDAFPSVLAVLRGETESSFASLLRWVSGELPAAQVANLTYRVSGSVIQNPEAPLIADLDTLPMPAYHLFPMDKFEILPIEAGRGCPFSCSFCSTNLFFNRRYRLKSPRRLIREMSFLIKNVDCRSFDLIHDMFTLDRKRVVLFCEALIAEGLQVNWGTSARVDCIDEALLELMSKAGCRSLFFGIESGSEEVQKTVKKKLVVPEVVPVLRYAASRAITPTASFIVGFPTENLNQIGKTFRLIIRLLHAGITSIQVHLLSPLPGSPLEREYKNELKYRRVVPDLSLTVIKRVDEYLIKQHPEVFSSFYSFPYKSLVVRIVTLTMYFFFGALSVLLRLYLPKKPKRERALVKTASVGEHEYVQDVSPGVCP